jgi:hypothetical protein
MGRPITLADDRTTPVNWVTNVQYGASSELKHIDYRIGAVLNNSGKLDSKAIKAKRGRTTSVGN